MKILKQLTKRNDFLLLSHALNNKLFKALPLKSRIKLCYLKLLF